MSTTEPDPEYVLALLKKDPSVAKHEKNIYGKHQFRIPRKRDIIRMRYLSDRNFYVLVKKVSSDTITGFLLDSFGDIANISDKDLYRSNFRPAGHKSRSDYHVFDEPTLEVTIDINKLVVLEILKLGSYDEEESRRERPNIIWNVLSGDTYDNYITGIFIDSFRTERVARRYIMKQWKEERKADERAADYDKNNEYNDFKSRKTDDVGVMFTYSIKVSQLR